MACERSLVTNEYHKEGYTCMTWLKGMVFTKKMVDEICAIFYTSSLVHR